VPKNVCLEPNAKLHIDFGTGGNEPEHDAVNVAFNASLSGLLQLTLLDGVVPSPTDTFTILQAGLQAGSLSGAFTNVASGQRLITSDGVGSFRVHYGPSSPFNPNHVVLSNFLAAVLSGDYNGDGTVDAADYVVWREGIVVAPTQDNYNVWRSHFSQTVGSGSASKVEVPEPACALLLLIGSAIGSWTARGVASVVPSTHKRLRQVINPPL
jgi:hypothetical protein